MLDRAPNVTNRVYTALRQQILERALMPGDVLSRSDIAAAHAVSATPVREALLRLQAEGFVHVVPQSGTTVTAIDIPALHRAQFQRVALESEVVRRLSRRPEAHALKEARLSHDSLTVETFEADDQTFHAALFAGVGMGALFADLQTGGAALARCKALRPLSETDVAAAIKAHADILSRIAACDPGGAVQAVRAHLSDDLAQLGTLRRTHPEMFRD